MPGAARLLDGTYAATGGTVAELVLNMTSSGLRFAPATPGNEAPYFALHSALVAFAAGDETGGFRATFDPFVQPPGSLPPRHGVGHDADLRQRDPEADARDQH